MAAAQRFVPVAAGLFISTVRTLESSDEPKVKVSTESRRDQASIASFGFSEASPNHSAAVRTSRYWPVT